jgi:hypothetical protein
MNTTGVWEFHKKLSYDWKTTVANIVSDLDNLTKTYQVAQVEKEQINQKRKYYIGCLLTAIVLLILTLQVSIAIRGLENLSTFISFWLVVAIIGFIIAIIYSSNKGNEYEKIFQNLYRISFTKEVLQMLARDMESSAEVEVHLSLKPVKPKENRINTIPHPNKPGWKIDNYRQEWLKIQGKFLDKTALGITATGLSKNQYGTKRSRSGKTKYKSKTKQVGLDINLTLAYHSRRYGAVSLLKEEVSRAIKIPNSCTIRRLKVTDKKMHLVVRILPQKAKDSQFLYQTVTMMLLSLYQVLNLAKKLSIGG